MMIVYLEVLLTILIIVCWMGPFLMSIRRGRANVLHPQFMTPMWVTYFVLNSMIQVWFSWMGETTYGILKTTSAEMSQDRAYLLMPLALLILCAPAYHFGVRIFNPSITKSHNNISIFYNSLKVLRPRQNIKFTFLAVLVSATCWIPNYLIPNGGYGTFWTYPLAMTNVILPLMLFNIHKLLGLLSLFFAFVGASIMASKASFVYPLIPFILYYIFLKFSFGQLRSWVLLCVGFLIIVTGFSLGGFGSDARRLFHRDYAFETFAALINKAENKYFGNAEYVLTGKVNGEIVSWTFNELEKGIPSIIHPGKKDSINPSKAVNKMYLPQDYKALPNAYMNRFLLFSGYYDLGFIGAIFIAFLFGVFYSFIWKFMMLKVLKTNCSWPIFLYMPIPAIGTYFIAVGGITYGLINSFVPIVLVYILIFISKLRLFLPQSEKVLRNGL